MTLRQEINQDIIENCDRLLEVLKNESVTNDTPAGRMIYQCRWLKEQAAADALSFPLDKGTHTLRYAHTEVQLEYLGSSPDQYWHEVGIYMYRLLYLIDGRPILKPPYYPYAIRFIDALVYVMRTATRPLDQYELGAIEELTRIKQLLADGKVEPPLGACLPDYPNFNEMFMMFESSIDDLPNGWKFCRTVADLIFEGVRPRTWTTPEAADRETEHLEGGHG